MHFRGGVNHLRTSSAAFALNEGHCPAAFVGRPICGEGAPATLGPGPTPDGSVPPCISDSWPRWRPLGRAFSLSRKLREKVCATSLTFQALH
jgi:hypothetical protein